LVTVTFLIYRRRRGVNDERAGEPSRRGRIHPPDRDTDRDVGLEISIVEIVPGGDP
jgi:hypothetical protein